MNCLDFRRAVAAEPQRQDTETQAHASSCPACAEFHEQMLALDRQLAVALRVPVPRESRSRLAPAQTRTRFAVAASVALAVAAAIFLALWLPRPSLAAEVVEHVNHEPASWIDTGRTVSQAELDVIARKAGVRIDPAIGPVMYAMPCEFRGHVVPHLVVRDSQGPVTIMILAHERVKSRQHFSEQGLTGVLLPAPQGAVAILTHDDARIDSIASRILESMS